MSKLTSLNLIPILSLLVGVTACGFPKTTKAPPSLPSDSASTQEAEGEKLARGRAVFTEKCNGCHGYPDVTSIPAARWPEIMKDMAAKSDIGPDDEAKVLAFVLAAQSAASTTK